MKVRFFRLVTVIFSSAVIFGVNAADGDYLLRVGDKIRLSVFKRPEISAEYTIRSSGGVSVPSIGEVDAAGLTMSDLEKRIAGRLGLKNDDKNHWVGIEVVEMQPIYVLGGVKSPGSYPFSSGMTVLHAISLAGGLRANIAMGPPDGFEMLIRREKLRHLQQSLGLSLARLARLKAEYDRSEVIEFPDELYLYLGADEAERVIQGERRMLDDRRKAEATEEAAFAQQRQIVDEEIRAHIGQLAAKTKAGELLRQEIEDMQPDKGIVPMAQIRALERVGVQIDGDKRELAAFIARAKLQRERIDQDSKSLVNARQVAIAEEMNQVQESIAIDRISIEELQIALAKAQADRTSIAAPWASRGEKIEIVRRTTNGMKKLSGSELTALEPGDVVKVPLAVVEAGSVVRDGVPPE